MDIHSWIDNSTNLLMCLYRRLKGNDAKKRKQNEFVA